MENNYSNLIEGNKPVTGQPVYTCRLCYKEFLYYRDFALHESMHERMHLDQMTLTSSLQGGMRHSYDNRPGIYNTTGVTGTTPLESFEKLIQPFRGDSELRAHPIPSSPALEPEKTAQVYRSEADTRSVPHDSRSTPVDTRGITMDTRNVAMETRPLPVDCRPLPVEARTLQPLDTRSIPVDSRGLQLDSRPMSYSTTSYLETLSRNLYPADLAKTQTATPTTFSTQPSMRPEDYFLGENRNQVLPKMDSQIYSKPDPYYGLSKSHYSHLGSDKATENYAATQYNLSKLLNPGQPAYYPPSIAGQGQGMDKISTPSPIYYNQPGASHLGVKQDKKLPSPKQTLYYGQPPLSQPLTHTTNTGYQMGMPRPGGQLTSPIPREILSPMPREIHSKPLDKPELSRSYQSGHASPHLTYTDFYKGSQSQTQVFSSVPAQAPPPPPTSQLDYSPYKLSSEPIPTVNIEFKPTQLGPPECYICYSPFANMNELSEHMKIHARAEISMENTAAVQMLSPQPPPAKLDFQMNTVANEVPATVVNSNPSNQHINSVTTSPVPYIPNENLICQVCTKTFLRPSFLAEHMKTHSVEQKYECKVCKKLFNKKAKCFRHEALHQRDILLFYCEICDESFKDKGNYLSHVQKKHASQLALSLQKETVNIGGGGKIGIENDAEHEKGVFIDCQVCDEEVEKNKLVEHLHTHPVHTCDKCEHVFVQKTEYVEHLMNSHYQELGDSSDKSGSDNSDTEAAEVDTSKTSVTALIGKMETETIDKKAVIKENNMKENGPKAETKEMNIEKKETAEREKTEVRISRKEQIKNLKEKKKEVMKNLKEKQKEILNLEKEKKKKESKTPIKEKEVKHLKEKEEDEKSMKDEFKDSNDAKDSELIIKDTKLKFSCSKCEQSFAKKSDLTLHVETHKKDPSKIYCEICDLSWLIKAKGYYIYHMKYHSDAELLNSTQPPQLTCNVCYDVIPRQTFVSHIVKQHTQFPCDICQWSYSSEKSMLKHIKSIHGNKKYKEFLQQQKEGEKVIEQKVVYRKLKDLKAEEKANAVKKATKVFTCMICIKTFAKKFQFEKHLKIHNLTIEEQQIKCEICNLAFSSRGTYLYHIQEDHNNSKNIESQANKHIKQKNGVGKTNEGYIEQSNELDNNSEQTMNKKDNISVETDKMNNENALQSDSNELVKYLEKSNAGHNNETADEIDLEKTIKETKAEVPVMKQKVITVLNPVTGDFEEKIVDEKEEPEMNVFENFVEEEKAVETNVDKPKETEISEIKTAIDVVSEIMYCKLCNKCLKKNVAYEHMKVHCIYNCHICQYAFTKKKTYLHHRKIMHFEDIIIEEIAQMENLEKSKKSEEIEKSKDQKAAESNKRKRAEIAKLMTCPLCTCEFKQDKYIDHVRSHSKLKLQCQFCDRNFSKKTNLVIHEKSHERISHEKNKLPYPRNCPVCNCSIMSREKYVLHMSDHSKRKPSKCRKCEEIFTNDRNLDNHMRVYHDPNIRVTWKVDGEGMKYDVKTGRIGEVVSDYICEIKEINELLKRNDKAEIWVSLTPKKGKEKILSQSVMGKKTREVDEGNGNESKNADDDDEEEEKVKVDTSDEDYVPEESVNLRPRRRSGRRKFSSEDEETDESRHGKRRSVHRRNVSEEEDETETDGEKMNKRRSGRRKLVSEDDENARKKRKLSNRRQFVSDDDDNVNDLNRRRSRRYSKRNKSLSENENNDDEDVVEEDQDEDYRPSHNKKRRSRFAPVDESSSDEEKYTPKGTRTRQTANVKMKVNQAKKSSRSKSLPSRVLRSKLEQIDSKTRSLKRKEVEESSRVKSDSVKKIRLSEPTESSSDNKDKFKLKPNEETPRKCPVCRKSQNSRRDYIEHMKLHSGQKPFKCSMCESSYTWERNLKAHILAHHKNYRPKGTRDEDGTSSDKTPVIGKLRTRAKNLNTDIGEPASTSTPIKGSKLVVKLSPLDIDKALNKVNKSTDDKNASQGNRSFVCEFCNKKMGHNKWNYTQHVQRHKKDMKKKGKESKPLVNKKEIKKKEESTPFSCKYCSESFKKKRDLYIHAEVHSKDLIDEDDNTMDVSYSTKTDTENTENSDFSKSNLSAKNNASAQFDTSENTDCKNNDVENTSTTENNKENEQNNDSHNTNTSLNDSLGVSADMDLGDSFSIDQETYKIVVSERKSEDGSETSSEQDSLLSDDDEQSKTKTEIENDDNIITNRASVNKSSETSVVSTSSCKKSQNSTVAKIKAVEQNESNGPTSNMSSEVINRKTNKDSSKTNAAVAEVSTKLENEESLIGNNNEENKKADDSESDEKMKQSRTPAPLIKISSESALSKWKAKVEATLSSQLELHAAKQMEEMANPEITKVKEYLSISGKPEKRKFECRICGDTFDLESSFKDHMNVHLNESPPYCNICDIYFMAIYPKRRLLEHYRKKHPELKT